ncbi:MAG: protein kinase [Gemmataceae bacterium]|nr:protein kinase [Gemmataceae bacterium]MCI0741622.1 protein kinase [Gemmataceae bacterium]
MSSFSSEVRSALVMELAEEFLNRYRKGELPPLKEYVDRHPELAAEIKEVFPAMAMMENIAVADSSLEGDEAEKKAAAPAEVALKQLGDYRIIREIGHGGMGVVYEAEQVSLGRHVALKVLPNQALADAKHKRRFEREAKAAAKLHHTNIVPVFGVGEHEGLPYYVMQFIQGLGLDVVLDELNRMQPGAAGAAHTPTGLPTAGEIRISRRNVAAADMARSLMTGAFQKKVDSDNEPGAQAQPNVPATLELPAAGDPAQRFALSASSNSSGLSESFTVSSSSIVLPGSSTASSHKGAGKKQSYWQSVANIGRQVADALEYAHKQGVLHRDVKPSNLLLDLRGTVWVTDFGLAKVAGPGGDNLTHTGDILGTLRYMPPEAFEGKSDARGDVYSLGLTMYELLAMRPAFGEKDRNKLIKHVTSGEPAPLHKVNRETPRDLVTIIHKAIDRDPGRRYATAEDMASDLQRFLDDEPILARRQTQLERYWRWARHNPGIAVLGGVLTAVLVIATLVSLVVAGRMSTLAHNEAQAAADERTARAEAEVAKNREAKEKKDADESRKSAEEALKKAEEHFAKARAAVNDYLTAVSEDERLKAPGLQGLRNQLLRSAEQFYKQFLKERGHDPTLRRELAGIYYKIGEINRDLKLPEAKSAHLESLRLYETLAKESPNDPDLQHGLAMSLYRSGARARAIPILEKLITPEDPRYHADLASVYNDSAIDAKTDKARELEFLRKALTVRERLVRLKPDDPDARLGLSASLNNIAINLKDDRNAEALALLQRAVEQGETAYRLRPADLLTARFLWIQLNNVASKAKKVGETELALAAHHRRVELLDRRARDNPMIVDSIWTWRTAMRRC